MYIKSSQNLEFYILQSYLHFTTARFLETKRMQGEAEVPQKMEVTPESIRNGNMYAQACIRTGPDAFVLYSPYGP